MMANETSRPGGFHAPTPNEQWRIRLLISEEEGESFKVNFEALREEDRVELGCLPGIDIGPCLRSAVDRQAITRAVVAHGIVKFRRRRISLPMSVFNLAKIS